MKIRSPSFSNEDDHSLIFKNAAVMLILRQVEG